jgi:hypothetical protein
LERAAAPAGDKGTRSRRTTTAAAAAATRLPPRHYADDYDDGGEEEDEEYSPGHQEYDMALDQNQIRTHEEYEQFMRLREIAQHQQQQQQQEQQQQQQQQQAPPPYYPAPVVETQQQQQQQEQRGGGRIDSGGGGKAGETRGGIGGPTGKPEHKNSVAKRRGPMDEMRQLQRILVQVSQRGGGRRGRAGKQHQVGGGRGRGHMADATRNKKMLGCIVQLFRWDERKKHLVGSQSHSMHFAGNEGTLAVPLVPA